MEETKKRVRVRQPVKHIPSRADNLDNPNIQNGIFPPAPSATQQTNQLAEGMVIGMGSGGYNGYYTEAFEPMAANGALGSSF